ITVFSTVVNGGNLALPNGADTLIVCLDDDLPDITDVTLSNTIGDSSQWIVTDTSFNILAIPSAPPFDFGAIAEGTCLLWHLSYSGELSGVQIEANVSAFSGCFDLSNPITIIRNRGINCETSFTAQLTGMSQSPCPVTTTGVGAVEITLDGNTIRVTGTFSRLSADYDVDLGAHLHLAAAGQTGPILFALTPSLTTDLRSGQFAVANNTFELNEDQLTALRYRKFYVNIPTLDHPAGEIRGQCLPSSATPYRAVLSGVEEVPSVVTMAHGELWFELSGNELTVSGSFSRLQGDLATEILGGAHIHQAVAGRTGPVVFPLKLSINEDFRSAEVLADSNVFLLSAEQVAALKKYELY
ncbi:MAG: CHRD domain-containing protein, partial [Bacteroidota bacterium]